MVIWTVGYHPVEACKSQLFVRGLLVHGQCAENLCVEGLKSVYSVQNGTYIRSWKKAEALLGHGQC